MRPQVFLSLSLDFTREPQHTACELTVRTSENTSDLEITHLERDFGHDSSPDDADERAQLGTTTTTLGADRGLLAEREVNDDVI